MRLDVIPKAQKRAFTLIELLVAVAILAILVIMFAQLMAVVSRTWVAGVAQVSSFEQARTVLDLMHRDVESMAMRRDLYQFIPDSSSTTNPPLPLCAFYTLLPGISGNRNISLIQYKLAVTPTSSVLQRLDYGMSYSATGPSPAFADSQLEDLSKTTSLDLATGVIGFQIQFLTEAGQFTNTFAFDYNGPLGYTTATSGANVKTVVVSLLVLDNQDYQLAVAQGKLPAIQSAFVTPPTNGSYAQSWNVLLNGGPLPGVPPTFMAGLRVFERRLSLPNTVVSE